MSNVNVEYVLRLARGHFGGFSSPDTLGEFRASEMIFDPRREVGR
jgi:hypothetical protein